jgi:hypothetical protein
MKYHSFGYLRNKLKEAGLPSNRLTLAKWEKEGRLVSPRSITNFKVRNGIRYPIRMYSEEQVEEIVRAFSPAGVGHWEPSLDR